MAVAKIKFLDAAGFPNAESILVEGNCMQHVEDSLAYLAMKSLVKNRAIIERQPWLADVINHYGFADDDFGNVAIAEWLPHLAFKTKR